MLHILEKTRVYEDEIHPTMGEKGWMFEIWDDVKDEVYLHYVRS